MKAVTIAVVSLALVALALGFRSERQYQSQFTSYMQQHQKYYHPDEFFARYNNFKANLDFIDAWNSDPEHTHTVAMNKFGDLHPEEVRMYYTGLQTIYLEEIDKLTYNESHVFRAKMGAKLDASKDWRKLGAVTPVKDQGQCGSCWSFSTTGAVEACHQLATGQLVGLSEQALMDCSWKYGNEGCNGGLMESAMDYIIAAGGLDTEASYPYKAVDGSSCHSNKQNYGATMKSYRRIQKGSETALQQAANTAPVSIAIDASRPSFTFYSSGVYTDKSCSSYSLDHGVLLVGWGSDSGSGDYWIVKNSWGSSWGMQGYIQMARNKNNQCGVATMATIPTC